MAYKLRLGGLVLTKLNIIEKNKISIIALLKERWWSSLVIGGAF